MYPEEHETRIENSEDHRAQIRADDPEFYDDAFHFMCRVLKRYDHQKYLVFIHQVFDTNNELGKMDVALAMAAYFLAERAKGTPADDAYITSFVLNYIGLCNFWIYPGGQQK